MKLLIIRHGDPDYSIDSLTKKGWREAEYLSQRLAKERIDAFYVSPLGRAQDTASCTLKRMHRSAQTCEWLQEFAPRIERPDAKEPICAWDWLPQDWTKDSRFFDKDAWFLNERMQAAGVKEAYDWVTGSFDRLLAQHGYVRDGLLYRAERANHDTLAFFCHFGLECVLLSHLLNVSPMVLWHGTCAAPSSVTTVRTEERREGIAYFRMSSFGDVAHLYVQGEPPAPAASFCECFTDDTRHD